MKKSLVIKAVVCGIILLLVGTSVISTTGRNIEKANRATNYDIQVFSPTDDTEISHDAPDTNCGNETSIAIRNEYGVQGSPGWASDGLIRFDISSIPTGSIIQSATLNLFYYYWTSTNPQGRELTLYRITNNWNEETATWNNQPTYYTIPTNSSLIPDEINNWIQWNVTSDIQKYVDGQATNYGWKITDESYWGDFNIPLTLLRSKENVTDSPYLEIEANLPPEIPTIDGPTSGDYREAHQWNFTTTDPDNDDIYYYVDWGDGENTNWSLAYNSGQTMPKSHEYPAKGTYTITAKAKDIYGLESDWGTLSVTMPCSYNIPMQWFWERLFERFPHAFPILRQLMGY